MRLHDLREVRQFPQLLCRWRDAHSHNRVASLGGSQQMADRTNPADARSDARHLIERASLGEFFESSHLRDVELGARNSTVAIQLNDDLRMSFDARHRIDCDTFHPMLLIRISPRGRPRAFSRPPDRKSPRRWFSLEADIPAGTHPLSQTPAAAEPASAEPVLHPSEPLCLPATLPHKSAAIIC